MALFIIFSGTIGPRIISHGLIDKDGFEIYGGAGKAVLFGAIALLVLIWRQGKEIKLAPWHKSNLIWLFAAIGAIAVAWIGVGKLIAGVHGAGWPLLVHACLIGSIAFAAGAAFGPASLRLVAKTYRRELLISIGLGAVFYIFLLGAYSLWQVLATIVLHAVAWLLNLVGVSAAVMPGHSLVLDKFAITVAKTCSGVESLALFTGLYALVGLLDWRQFNRRKLLLTFPAALAILFICNILRVFVLVLGGYYINPHIAFSLFHTYAGMLFFIIYSIAFWAVSYGWLLKD